MTKFFFTLFMLSFLGCVHSSADQTGTSPIESPKNVEENSSGEKAMRIEHNDPNGLKRIEEACPNGYEISHNQDQRPSTEIGISKSLGEKSKTHAFVRYRCRTP